ncbi:uncharacterized protein [Triticum aestivum]|uniref:uncharacterized protein n=1 Tax=Triticum aestivum TaxID=4565 RepID=UPI001D01BB6C|nr:uncharacterized protein LOC123139756 [Triticum aestivum]
MYDCRLLLQGTVSFRTAKQIKNRPLNYTHPRWNPSYRSAEMVSHKASEAGSGTIASDSEAWLGARRLATAQAGAREQAGRSGSWEAAGVVGDEQQEDYYDYNEETDDDDDDDDDDYKSPPSSPKGHLIIA